ncbi:WYL domain-containing protein [Lutispora sp.]|uniref:WYL domain-containing protein n=1 Tax=Lutispora sp. TaxID=2828727 RepID=UPI00356A6662
MNGVICLEAMELFLEGKNKNYSLILELINSLYYEDRKTISSKEINDMIENHGIPSEFNLSQSLMNENEPYNLYLLDRQTDGNYSLFINSGIPVQPYRVEKQWLKHIIKNPKLKLFLENGTITKLEDMLAEYKDIVSEGSLSINRPCKQLEEIDDNLRASFRLIIKAILENKGIEYSYMTKNEILLKNRRSIPYKLEYSMKEDWFYLISYSLDEKRPVKSLLRGFRDMHLIDLEGEYDISRQDIEKSIEAKKAPHPIVLQIKDVNNSLERALFQFSCFQRELDYDKDKDIYCLSIFYYEFEREEVLTRIFSLGRHAIVIEPEVIRAEIIKRLMVLKKKY